MVHAMVSEIAGRDAHPTPGWSQSTVRGVHHVLKTYLKYCIHAQFW
jgi:hypothetical protein